LLGRFFYRLLSKAGVISVGFSGIEFVPAFIKLAMNNLLRLIRGLCFVPLLASFNSAAAQQPVLDFQTVATGLNNPVDIVTAPGDNRLFIAQQNGIVRIWNGTTFLDFINLAGVITDPPVGEQGLLSIVFHPGYATNRYFFVWYTSTTGAVTLARYQRNSVNPDIADPGSGQVLLSIPKPGNPYFTNHNGGKLIFGADGMLYIGTGDGGSGGDPLNNAQNGNSLLGKMLRIDVNGFSTSYNIPPDNPFLTPGDNILDEIYAIGLRNPWRWSFDRANGDMWIADVGQNLWEEVNWRRTGNTAGVNYGWRCYEGAHIYAGGGCTPTDTVSPIFEYPHNGTTGGFSVTGGYVYRGPDPQNAPLVGYYITADYVSGNVWSIRANGSGGWNSYLQAGLPGNISSFGEGADGTLYALARSAGTIYKVMLSTIIPVTITHFTAVARTGYNELEWRTSNEINTRTYHVEYSTDGSLFSRVGQVPANGNSSANSYTFRHRVLQGGDVYYRLVTEEADGSTKISGIVRLQGSTANIRIYPTVLHPNGTLNLVFPQRVQNLQLLNSTGSIAWQKDISNVNGATSIAIPNLPAGVYIIRINGWGVLHQQKIIIR
jgi:glucose/arabinose dehydrogenase